MLNAPRGVFLYVTFEIYHVEEEAGCYSDIMAHSLLNLREVVKKLLLARRLLGGK